MKVIKSNQELELGRKYLCRNKVPYTSGTFAKPQIKEVTMQNEGNRQVRLLGGEWSFDRSDRILSFDGEDRIAKEALALNLAENPLKPRDYYLKYIQENPFQSSYFGVPILDSDCIENSQALEKWDVLGPIPEIKEELLHCLFNYPAILELLSKPVSIYPDGSVAVKLPNNVPNFSEDGWFILFDEADVASLNQDICIAGLDPNELVKMGIGTALLLEENEKVNNSNQLPTTCVTCNKEMIYNVPRLGEGGGYIHKDTGKFECDIKRPSGMVSSEQRPYIPRPNDTFLVLEEFVDVIWNDGTFGYNEATISLNWLAVVAYRKAEPVEKPKSIKQTSNDDSSKFSKPDECGFVTTESCGDKVGKQIRLTEKKHNMFGYYNEGAILIISEFDEKLGYCAGIFDGVKTDYPIDGPNSIKSVFRNIVTVGYDGFEFVD